MKSYTFEFRQVDGIGILTYNDQGHLEKVDITELKIPDKNREWFWGWVPGTLEILKFRMGDRNNKDKVTIKPLKEDLSFKRFYDLYGNKVGKKARAEKLWGLLTDAEKAKAIQSVRRYKFWLANRPGVTMLYPETYLSQKRFENEYT